MTYQAEKGGPLLAALQLRPKVDAPARPLDVLVLVEDAAGMAQGPMIAAQKTAEALAAALGADDRMALWTVSNKAVDLSRGFKSGDKLKDAFKDLAKDYPSGAVDLKNGLADALKAFQPDPTRQRVVLFFGDGKSLASPLDDADRAALCDQMVHNEIAFFAVPMGTDMDAVNLHSLVSGTGGKVVRFFAGDKPEDMARRPAAGVRGADPLPDGLPAAGRRHGRRPQPAAAAAGRLGDAGARQAAGRLDQVRL